MDADRNAEAEDAVQAAFLDALEHETAEREVFLRELASQDADLARQVGSLLAAHEDAGEGYLTPSDVWDRPHAGAPVGDLVGQRLGSFHLTRVLGRGGMGVVYEALQERPRRKVALKVVRYAVAGEAPLRRFEFESETLARLRHPGIAQIFESGTHVEGGATIPWFAMEYVEGAQTIVEHARSNELSVPERLALFVRICEAVQHGHQKGVIHRDLKPGNVLVDAEGNPKIIDFGVACSTDADVSLTTVETDAGRIVGTLAAMSPEQCAGDGGDIDTRSDVYSLGVLLYELLSGAHPHELEGKSVVEAIQVVRERAPVRLSRRDPSLAGDLETIVGKALEKDRELRYPSAAGLARDVGHFLAREPIEARPPSSVYRLRMLARRHRVASAALVLLAVVLVAGIAATSQGWSEALAARDEADAKAETSRVLSAFLLEMVRSPDPFLLDLPEEAGVRDVLLTDALEASEPRISEMFAGQPEVELTVRLTYAGTYRHLGRLEGAREHVERALELSREIDDDDSLRRLEVLDEKAAVLTALGELDEGEALVADVYARLRARGEPLSRVAPVGNSLAYNWRLQSRLDEAEALYTSLLEESLAALGPHSGITLDIQNNLARLYDERGRYAEAIELLEDTLLKQRTTFGDAHPQTLTTLNNLALALDHAGDGESAVEIYRRALEAHLRVLGEDHASTLTVMSNLGGTLVDAGRFEEAEELMRRALERRRLALGEAHPDTFDSRSNYAYLLLSRGRYAEGAAALEELVAAAEGAGSVEDWHLGLYRVNLGNAYFVLRELDPAREQLEQAVDVLERTLGADDPRTQTARSSLDDVRRALDAAGSASAER